MKKIVMFLFCLSVSTAAHAEPLLNFEAGQKAAYTVKYEHKSNERHQRGGNEFNVEIVKVNKEKGYIDAKVQLTRVHFTSRCIDPVYGSTRLFYDSAKKSKMSAVDTASSEEFDHALQIVLGKTLHFRIKKDFNLQERSGKFKIFDAEVSQAIPLQEKAIAQTIIELVGQIFHLADKDAGAKEYTLPIYPILRNYDPEIKAHSKLYKINEKASFVLVNDGEEKLEGKWSGSSSILAKKTKFAIDLKLDANISFSKKNPLLLTRESKTTLHLKQPGYKANRFTVYETWTSRPN